MMFPFRFLSIYHDIVCAELEFILDVCIRKENDIK